MTRNQLEYWNLQETIRSNKTDEEERERMNTLVNQHYWRQDLIGLYNASANNKKANADAVGSLIRLVGLFV